MLVKFDIATSLCEMQLLGKNILIIHMVVTLTIMTTYTNIQKEKCTHIECGNIHKSKYNKNGET